MSVVNAHATIECDGCGCQFRVDIDTAYKPTKWKIERGWSLFDEIVDTIRGGYCTVTAAPKHLRWANVGMCSVQDGKHLCPACTREADKEGDDDPEAPAKERA